MSKTVRGTVAVSTVNRYEWCITVPDDLDDDIVRRAVEMAAGASELDDGGVYRALDMITALDVLKNDQVSSWDMDWRECVVSCDAAEVWEPVVHGIKVGDRCVYCDRDTSFGSGLFVNRVPADGYLHGDQEAHPQLRDGYACVECLDGEEVTA